MSKHNKSKPIYKSDRDNTTQKEFLIRGTYNSQENHPKVKYWVRESALVLQAGRR